MDGLKLPYWRKGFNTTKCRGAGEIHLPPAPRIVSFFCGISFWCFFTASSGFPPIPPAVGEAPKSVPLLRCTSLFRFRLGRFRSSRGFGGFRRGRASAGGYVRPCSRASRYPPRSRYVPGGQVFLPRQRRGPTNSSGARSSIPRGQTTEHPCPPVSPG